MVPVKIYVVLTPSRLIFGPNLSDTLIILPTHSLTAFYSSGKRLGGILIEEYWAGTVIAAYYLWAHLCECKCASSCQTSGEIVSRSTDRDMAFNKNNLSLETKRRMYLSNLVSLWINKWVERVELRLKHFPHSLHSNNLSALWIALDMKTSVISTSSLKIFNCLPMLGETNLMTKCLVTYFTGVGSESIILNMLFGCSRGLCYLLPLWLLLTCTSKIWIFYELVSYISPW